MNEFEALSFNEFNCVAACMLVTLNEDTPMCNTKQNKGEQELFTTLYHYKN